MSSLSDNTIIKSEKIPIVNKLNFGSCIIVCIMFIFILNSAFYCIAIILPVTRLNSELQLCFTLASLVIYRL